MKSHATLKGLFLIHLFSFFFSISYGQVKVDQFHSNGLSTTIFNTELGKVTVFMPEHRPNEQISGTIKIESIGNSEKKKQKNRVELQNFQLALGDKRISVTSNTFELTTKGTLYQSLKLIDAKGKEVLRSDVSATNTKVDANQQTYIPSFMVAGEPSKLRATCDGSLSNNTVSINNSPIEMLAESESGVFIRTPMNEIGESQILFDNEGQVTESTTHILGLDLSVGSVSLRRGQTTSLHIKISGLEGLDENVQVTIINNSTANISLQGGDHQQFIVDPRSESTAGNYMTTRTITAKQQGGFEISVNLQGPGPEESTSSTQELLCNCYLNDESFLISSSACAELGGTCSDQNSEDDIDEIEDDIAPGFTCDIPDEIIDENAPINLLINDLYGEDCLAVQFSYRPIEDQEWQLIGEDNTFTDGLNVSWNPPLGNDGPIEIRTQVVNKNDVVQQINQFINLNVTPQALNAEDLNISFSISNDAIDRVLDRARATGDRIKKEQDRLAELRLKWWDAYDKKNANKKAKNALIAIDKVLDKVPKAYKDSLKAIVDSLTSLKKQLPTKIDTSALKKAVDDAQKRLDDCKKRLEELKQEQRGLEAERDNLKQELDDTLKEMDNLFTENGWTGGYGYHSDGRPWFGYVGNDQANIDIDDEKSELKKKIKTLKKPYLKALRRLEQLPNEINEAQAECDKLEEALRKAKEAAEKGDQYMATEVKAEDICRQIQSLLRPIYQWCIKNPSECSFKSKLDKLLKECPKDNAALADFWDDFDDVVKAKKQQEETFGDAERAGQSEENKIADDIKNAEDRITALRKQQEREYAEAERLRKQRAKAIEDERQRQRNAAARKKAEEKRKEAKPQPILDEPVDPSNDQLKAQANSFVFKRLYLDYLIANGPCDCTTKAIAFANNSNTIWSDLVGRIGVGVTFAPLESFPGVSLAGKLGLAAAKSLASAIFGGQSFSEELTKNLFDVIGGEIFPKLVGNNFTGDRINDIAGKGLEEILEAEGARAVKWDGKVKIKDCGEVEGSTTMLINPNTGWVIILIKIEGCPLVVIKYKVNKDGVPTTTPSVTTIKG